MLNVPKTPIIIIVNLNTAEPRRTLFRIALDFCHGLTNSLNVIS